MLMQEIALKTPPVEPLAILNVRMVTLVLLLPPVLMANGPLLEGARFTWLLASRMYLVSLMRVQEIVL